MRADGRVIPPDLLDLDAIADAVADLVAAKLADRADAGQSPWLGAQEAADYLGLSLGTLRNLTSARALPFHKPTGGHVWYRRNELDAWLDASRDGRSTPCS